MTTNIKMIAGQVCNPKGRIIVREKKSSWIKKIQALIIIIALFFSFITNAQNSVGAKSMQPLPRDLEIQLALSALPPHLRDAATVYVLNFNKGFEVARKGTNGFHAFVARTGDDAMQGSWPLNKYRDDVLYPISFDSEGAKVQMRVFFDIAEMQAKDTPPEELKKLIQQRFKTGFYKAPTRPGLSYMLSPILRTYTNPAVNDGIYTLNFPHVMNYVPNVTNEQIGAAKPKPEDLDYIKQHGRWQHTPYPFVISQGPHGYLIQARGNEERTAINKEYAPMLARLAKIRKEWALPANPSMAMQHHHVM